MLDGIKTGANSGPPEMAIAPISLGRNAMKEGANMNASSAPPWKGKSSAQGF
nr:hypothetical protein [uncultured Ottowia sp.]